MATLGSLVISLAADTARFEGDLGRAAAIAESRMRNIKDSATRALGALTVVASAAGAALVAGLKQATDRADDMRDLAAASGVTVEQLSRLGFAGQQSGVELEKIGKALAKLAKGGATDANAELLRLADQFRAMPDGAAKTAAAIDIFGEKLGPGLIPLLNEGREGLQALADTSDRFGATISGATADAADAFNDNLGALKLAATGLGNSLASDLLPFLAAYSGQVVEAAKSGDQFRTSVGAISTLVKGLVVGVDFAVTTFQSFGRAIGAVFAALAAFDEGEFSRAGDILRELRKDADEVDKGFAERYLTLTEGAAMQVAQKAPELAKQIASPVTKAAVQVKDSLAEIQSDMREWLARLNTSVAQDIARDVKQNYDGTLYTLEVRAQETTEKISTFAEQGARNMQSAFADFLFDPFQDGLKGMLRSFIDVIRRMVAEQAAAKLLGSKSDGGFGFGDVVTGAISSFFGGFKASGGPVSGGKAYVVGEQGPELFMPGRSGTIVPNGAMGSTTLAPVINIDARGATVDAVKLLPAAMEQAANMAVARMQDMLSRRAMR